MRIKIVSWNVAGGRKVKSLDQFDYEAEDLNYFASEIKKINPDIVCFQESHSNSSRSISNEIAQFLKIKNVFDSPFSPSHIDSNYQLGVSIIPKFSFIAKNTLQLPYPKFKLYWKNGREADIHHKAMQKVLIEGFNLVNIQLLPLGLWGFDYSKDKGKEFSLEIDKTLNLLNSPLIFCGDINFDKPDLIYPKLIKRLCLKEALPNLTTRPTKNNSKKTPDHIFYSPEFLLIDSGIIQTQTDHYLCFAEFEFVR